MEARRAMRPRAAVRFRDFEPAPSQRLRQEQSNGVVIIDDQDCLIPPTLF